MKLLIFTLLIAIPALCVSQDVKWVSTQGEITEITIHHGKRMRESAQVKFYLENGAEQIGHVDLLRIPFIGSMTTVGDKITVSYNAENPVVLKTKLGQYLSDYGLYILIVLGIIFSIKPFLKYNKRST